MRRRHFCGYQWSFSRDVRLCPDILVRDGPALAGIVCEYHPQKVIFHPIIDKDVSHVFGPSIPLFDKDEYWRVKLQKGHNQTCLREGVTEDLGIFIVCTNPEVIHKPSFDQVAELDLGRQSV